MQRKRPLQETWEVEEGDGRNVFSECLTSVRMWRMHSRVTAVCDTKGLGGKTIWLFLVGERLASISRLSSACESHTTRVETDPSLGCPPPPSFFPLGES